MTVSELNEHLRKELVRLSGVAFKDLQQVASGTSATRLFADAAFAAERSIPGPLGVAIAGVLVKAGYERSLHGMGGSLGAEYTMLALAVAAMEHGVEGTS